MAECTSSNQEPGHAQGSRGTAARLAHGAPRPKRESLKGLASPKRCRDKIANEFVAINGKIQTPSSSPAMAARTINVPGSQVPLNSRVRRTRQDLRNDFTSGAVRGNKKGLGSLKPYGDVASKAMANKMMDDRVKNEKLLNAEGRSAVRARLEQKRAPGKPLPKRGNVKKAIVEAGVKKIIDTGKALCCAPGPLDVDAFVRDLPFPTRSETTATLWDKVEV